MLRRNVKTVILTSSVLDVESVLIVIGLTADCKDFVPTFSYVKRRVIFASIASGHPVLSAPIAATYVKNARKKEKMAIMAIFATMGNAENARRGSKVWKLQKTSVSGCLPLCTRITCA